MTRLILILLILFSLNVSGQDYSSNCRKGTRKAEKDIAKSRIKFYELKRSQIQDPPLRAHHEIKNLLASYDIDYSLYYFADKKKWIEHDCYNLRMKDYFDQSIKSGFIDMVFLKADSLFARKPFDYVYTNGLDIIPKLESGNYSNPYPIIDRLNTVSGKDAVFIPFPSASLGFVVECTIDERGVVLICEIVEVKNNNKIKYSESIEREVIRRIKKLGYWSPGMIEDRPVRYKKRVYIGIRTKTST